MRPPAHESLPVVISALLCAACALSACQPAKIEDEGVLSSDECIDGVDNDADGLQDCFDEGCQSWNLCAQNFDTASGDSAPPVDDHPRVALTINEFQASNSTTIADESGAYPDWIELYNAEPEALDLAGFTLSNDLETPALHTLGALSVEAGGYLLLWADGDVADGDQHLGFNLPSDGGTIGLYDDQGRALTRLEYAPQAADWSAARVPDGTETWVATETPTPGASNAP